MRGSSFFKIRQCFLCGRFTIKSPRKVRGIQNVRGYSTKSPETELGRHLKTRIKATGPITVAEYMRDVLTNPVSGYYMHRDVFGSKGDFITSPEISQMFGEMIGIWCVNEWMQGEPRPLQVVELGPGRGTLADDMLRVFSQFPDIKKNVSLHMVEVSPKLSSMQAEKLSGQPADEATNLDISEACYRRCTSKQGIPVSWYRQLSDVPRGLSVYVAHEFFDALPIHKFQKTSKGWCEVMVDVDEEADGPHQLRFVLSRGATPAVATLLQSAPDASKEHIEICPEGGVLVQELATRISQDGGWSLIIDYGHNGEKADTFRAFKQHKLHDPLEEPGSADLTADVDFSYLQQVAGNQVSCFGPINQEQFLFNMGIRYRLQALMAKAEKGARKDLISGYDMLTNPKKMGERFKFFGMIQHKDGDYTPAGFLSQFPDLEE